MKLSGGSDDQLKDLDRQPEFSSRTRLIDRAAWSVLM
jgi:hypothetical protein